MQPLFCLFPQVSANAPAVRGAAAGQGSQPALIGGEEARVKGPPLGSLSRSVARRSDKFWPETKIWSPATVAGGTQEGVPFVFNHPAAAAAFGLRPKAGTRCVINPAGIYDTLGKREASVWGRKQAATKASMYPGSLESSR